MCYLLPRNFALVLVGARARGAASQVADLPFAVAAFGADEDLAVIFSEAFAPVAEDVLALGASALSK